MTANYLLMSDINNRILYVLQIQKSDVDRIAIVTRISEFLLPAQFMSFCIVNANISKIRYTNSSDDLYRDDVDDFDDEENVLKTAVTITMYVVQPKRLQECNITFQADTSLPLNLNTIYPAVLEDNEKDGVLASNGSKSDDEQEYDQACKEITKLDDLQSSVALLIQQQQNNQAIQPTLNLMTPDDFNSPVINSSPNSIRNSVGNNLGSPSLMEKSLESLTDPPVENLIDFQQPQKDNFASGGSSPSREVQEILALQNPSYDPQEYFDNLNKLENEDSGLPQNDFHPEENEKSKEVVWPNISMMKAIEIEIKEENRRQELQLASQEDTENNQTSWDKTQLQMLNYKINALECLINGQTEQIRKLNEKSQTNMDELKSVFAKELEIAMEKNQTQSSKFLESFVKEQKRKEREQVDTVMSHISKVLTKEINDNLQTIIAHEIKTHIVPSVFATFENLQHQLDMHYSQKLNTIDHLLKNNISKLVGSKVRI